MRLDQLIYSQGFGVRRHCAALIASGFVEIDGQVCTDPTVEISAQSGQMVFSVEGQLWVFHEKAYLMLHKPAGFECSQRPSAWPSIYTLLPTPLRQRPGGGKSLGVQAVGRLDQDTTGLLLLTDDGAFVRRMTSPRFHVPKVYEVITADAIDDMQLLRLRTGVVLRDDPHPVKAVRVRRLAECHLQLTLTEGKYHQVKRMVAAVGNHVKALHRSQIGTVMLTPDLPVGQWRWLSAQELKVLSSISNPTPQTSPRSM